MPGFPLGGLAVDGLAPGVNVIYGPNASGKTTLARAMQRLLRADDKAPSADCLKAGLVVAGRPLDIEYPTRDTEQGVPLLAREAAEAVKNRYVLALHDLIQHEDEHDIVSQIVSEAAGGYDLKKAAGSLCFQRDQPWSRRINEVAEYEEARDECKKAEDRLKRINDDEEKLADLCRERKQVADAESRKKLMERALEAIESRKKLDEATRAFEAFPETLSKLVGDEGTRLTEIKKEMAQLREKLALETRSVAEANQRIARCGLPDAGVPEEFIATLQHRCDGLRSRAADIDRSRAEYEGASAGARDALTRLGGVSIEGARALDTATLDELFKFMRTIEDWRAHARFLDHLHEFLGTVPPIPARPETLKEGVSLLHRWLGAQQSSAEHSMDKLGWLMAAGVCGVVSLAMAFVHLSWLLLLLLATGLAVWAFLPHRPVSAATGHEIQLQWAALNFPPLSCWTEAEVRRWLHRLEQDWADAKLYEKAGPQWALFRKERDKYLEWQSQVAKARQEWASRLGLDLKVDEVELYLFAQNVQSVQQCSVAMNYHKGKLDAAQIQYDGELATLNADLAPFFSSPTGDLAQALARVRDLDNRRQLLNAAIGERNRAQTAAEEVERKLAELETNRTKLFSKLGLTANDEVTLRRLIDQIDEFRRAERALRIAEHDYDVAKSALGGHPELLEQTRPQLDAELQRCRDRASQREGLDRKIGGIEEVVRQAKDGNALEAALAREAACRDRLRAKRDSDGNELVGNVLFKFLARQQRDFQHPGVFTRASKLFARITHGRYDLAIRAGDPPAFRAFDTALGQEQNLDDLSSGTRLQLLLAVRVAFVERQERGLQLPLVFDETLGNSDERRAQAIIETAIEIARGGRQVFYLTAQYDELGKWRRILQECSDVPHREFDLAVLRQLDEADRAPAVVKSEAVRPDPVPAPDRDDWQAYRTRLNVPPVDPRGDVGGVHLWHLIDDVDELYAFLVRDISKWGQLETLVETGQCDRLTKNSPLYCRAMAAAELLERLFRLWRQGRGKPLDHDALEDSCQSSHLPLDKVSRVAEGLRGDPQKLLDKLRAQKRGRLPDEKVDALEEYLYKGSYLDDQPILDAAGIREAVVPLVERHCREGLLSRERVDQLVAAVANFLPVSDDRAGPRDSMTVAASDDAIDEPRLMRKPPDFPGEQRTLF